MRRQPGQIFGGIVFVHNSNVPVDGFSTLVERFRIIEVRFSGILSRAFIVPFACIIMQGDTPHLSEGFLHQYFGQCFFRISSPAIFSRRLFP
jgi:hypothetical protein